MVTAAASLPSSPEATYAARLAEYESAARHEDARSRRYSRARLLAAAVSLAALIIVIRSQGAPAGVVLGFTVAIFVWLVVRHDRIEQRRDAALAMATLNRQALARRARSWHDLPPPWQPALPDDHPFASDLDVFGHASLVQVLGPVRTPTGRRTLAAWLLHGGESTVGDVQQRQQAVRELVPLLEFRQQLAALARLLPETSGDVDDRDLPPAVHWVPVAAVVLAVLTLAGAVGAVTGLVTGPWFLLTGTLGWMLRWWVREPLEHAVGGASGQQGLRPWSAAIDHVHAATFTTPLLAATRRDLDPAPAALRALEQLVAIADVRHSVWLFVPLQTLTLWDLHVWWAIERWRGRHGAQVRGWLEAVGQVEAAGALASLAYDHPSWAFPVLDGTSAAIDGVDVGHPLLADHVRVGNDVRLGPPGRFLLITGSNMSGKSTLLRAIGLNVVLTHAGGPTCAAAFTTPRLALHTSMRVSDSLELGLSLFMASLVRLQRIVAAARTATTDRRVCFLLDEVLQGTNSAERQIAVKTVVDHLLGCEAIGAVTTHDLELARDAAFSARADSVHLQETLVGSGAELTMTFDYRLRPGPAQAGNALQLLRMLGLSD